MSLPTFPATVTSLPIKARIVPAGEHCVLPELIGDAAQKVMRRLHSAGYQAFLVGGGVRDLLLGREPKDFDVATDALPEQVKVLFRSCRLIGRRFRLAHVRFGREIIEVATFRGEGQEEVVRSSEGRIIRDNVYGSLEEDVWRRDFTVNALYYRFPDGAVVDYVGGVEDMKRGQLRLIGDPEQRYVEDPVRLLRAVRFAAKLGFRIHPETAAPIMRLAPQIVTINRSRLFDEVLKVFMNGLSLQAYELLRQYGLFAHLFPQTEQTLQEQEGGFPHTFIARALENTDLRLNEGKPVSPGFLIAVLLWDPLQQIWRRNRDVGLPEHEAMQLAIDTVLSQQMRALAIPARVSVMTRDIWSMQRRLVGQRHRKDATRLAGQTYFRAAYDFLLLRAELSEGLDEAVAFWGKLSRACAVRRGTGTRHEARRRRRRLSASRSPR